MCAARSPPVCRPKQTTRKRTTNTDKLWITYLPFHDTGQDGFIQLILKETCLARLKTQNLLPCKGQSNICSTSLLTQHLYLGKTACNVRRAAGREKANAGKHLLTHMSKLQLWGTPEGGSKTA